MLENQSLILDLVEWVGKRPRTYDEVMGTWQTSCPRLPIWEDAVDHGFVTRTADPEGGAIVKVTASGQDLLVTEGRKAPVEWVC